MSGLRSQAILGICVLAISASGCAAVAGGLMLGGGYVAGRLALKTRLTQKALLKGSGGQVGLVVGIEAMKLHGPRPPLNAALVLDRSGSMSGAKLRYAKAAARQFVRALRRGDRLALISYSNHARLVVPSANVDEETTEQVLSAIERITASGMTHLSGGLLMGRDQVLLHKDGRRVNRVILISDGIANRGITSPLRLSSLAEDMRERDVSITTMGVGLQFNEDLMMRLADRGGGNYYYIRNANRMASAFGQEFESMAGIVAKRPELNVTLAPGVRVKAVHGYEFEQRGRNVRVRLSDISSGSRRKVVLSLAVPTGTAGRQRLAHVNLAYRGPRGQVSKLDSPVAAEVTESTKMAYRSVDKDALQTLSKAEAATVMQRAITRFERGDVGGARIFLEKAKKRIRHRARRFNFSADDISGSLSRVGRGLKQPMSAPARQHFLKMNKAAAQEYAR